MVASGVHVPPLTGAGYANTTFEDGIEETFAVGNHVSSAGHYPIYLATSRRARASATFCSWPRTTRAPRGRFRSRSMTTPIRAWTSFSPT